VADRLDTFQVVFVCTGNRARSPLAQAFLAALVEPLHVRVLSRGTLHLDPAPALPEAIIAGALHGVDLSGHQSAAIAKGELADANLVVGFEPFHVAAALVDGGAPHGRAFTIIELVEILERLHEGGFLPQQPSPTAVVAKANGARQGQLLSAPALADPLGTAQRNFDRVAGEIKALVAAMAHGVFGASVPTAGGSS
jgi:protein-tyrosine phosphatase